MTPPVPLMSDDDKLMVPICRDHFQRLVSGDTCVTCPSKAENEVVVQAMAKLFDEDRDGVMKALATEIQSIRTWQKAQAAAVEKACRLHEDILSLRHIIHGPDGTNGLRGTLKDLAAEFRDVRKLVWIGMGICVAASVGIPVVVAALMR